MFFAKLLPLAALAYAFPAEVIGEDALADIKFKEYPVGGTQLKFGIALPTAPTGKGDFIGQLTGTGIGWGGIALGPAMVNYILVVAEPTASGVTGSLHKTSRRSYPPPLKDANVKLQTIASGTSASAGNWQYTFLCSGCLAPGSANFTQDGAGGAIAWAYSSSPKLNYHSMTGHTPLAGLAEAKTDGYGAFAATAQ